MCAEGAEVGRLAAPARRKLAYFFGNGVVPGPPPGTPQQQQQHHHRHHHHHHHHHHRRRRRRRRRRPFQAPRKSGDGPARFFSIFRGMVGLSDSLRVYTIFLGVPGDCVLFSHSVQAPMDRFLNLRVKLPAPVDTALSAHPVPQVRGSSLWQEKLDILNPMLSAWEYCQHGQYTIHLLEQFCPCVLLTEGFWVSAVTLSMVHILQWLKLGWCQGCA